MAESFNYISFGNWEYVQGHVDVVTMGRGRMFEYTPSDTEKRLESLDRTAIAFLESLPTFLCCEIKSAGNAVSMLIKYGRVSKVTPRRKEVSTTFKMQIDFGEVSSDDIEMARSMFGADQFQLYRTHWAVREGDAREVLARLSDQVSASTHQRYPGGRRAQPAVAHRIADRPFAHPDGAPASSRHARNDRRLRAEYPAHTAPGD